MSSQTTQLILWYVSVSSNALPILMGIWAWREMTKPLRFIWGTFILGITLAATSITIAYMGGSTHWLFYAGPVVYGLLFGMAYLSVLHSVGGRITSWLTLVLPIIAVIALLSFEGIKMMNLSAYAVLDALVTALTLLCFNEQMRRSNGQPLQADPWFWINLATILFWGYGLLTSFIQSASFGYNQQLFDLIFFGLSPFMQFLNIALVCVGFWRVKMNGLGSAKAQILL